MSSETFRVDSGAELVMRQGSWNNVPYDGSYEGSVMAASSAGARLSLEFTGTHVAVYGMIPPDLLVHAAPGSRYFIDGQLVGSYTPTFRDVPQTNVLFFQSPILPDGSHRLMVEYESVPNSDMLAIDYFEVNNGPAAAPTSSTPTPSRSSTPSTSSSLPTSRTSANSDTSTSETTSGSDLSRSASLTASASSGSPSSESDMLSLPSGIDSNDPSYSFYVMSRRHSSNGAASPTGVSAAERDGRGHGPPIAAIIGGAIGGLAIMAIIILATVYLKRRKEKKRVELLGRSDSSTRSLSPFHQAQNPSLPEEVLSEKAALAEELADGTPIQAQDDTPATPPSSGGGNSPASITNHDRQTNRHTMHSIRTTRTAGTALPAYELRYSNLTSMLVRADPPPPEYHA